ncbi:MAG: hypothetical protein ACRCV9_14445 [Burkholderiaceae bacterium]
MKPIQLQNNQLRQGDVLLRGVPALPAGCTKIEPENGTRFVLAHGEVTGHAHAIYEFTAEDKADQDASRAAEIGSAAVARISAMRIAQMWTCPQGECYLEVTRPTQMRHEEHSAPTIPVGVYHCPIQVQDTVGSGLRRVAD